MRLQRVSRLSQITHYTAHHHLHRTLSHRSFTTSPTKKVKIKKKKSSKSDSESLSETTSATSTDATSLSAESTTESLAAAAVADSDGGGEQESSSSDKWRMKWYKFRRMAMILGIPFAISTGLFSLHESDLPYVWCLKRLQKYPLPDDFDPSQYSLENPPPNPAPSWAQMGVMLWASQFNAWKPMKIMKQWNNFMPLLDKKYPAETRMVAIACLMGMLSGDTNTLPPIVFFEKCLRKLEILEGYKGSDEDGNWTTERFLNMIYSLCGETTNQQLMFAGLQLLLDLTSIPNEPRMEDVQFIMEQTKDIPNMRQELAYSLLIIYQDPVYIVDFIKQNPPKPRQAAMQPDFVKIKRILIENDCMKFAFSLLNAQSMQLKQLAMFILIGLVGNYPDINEIKRNLGEDDDEKLQNGIKLVDSLAGIGQEHFQRGDNAAALGAFTEALKYLPRSAQLRFLAGRCLAELGRIDEAKKEYRKAMDSTPAQSGPMPEATMQLCNLLIKHAKSREDIEEAAEYLEMLIDQGTYHMFLTVENIEIEDIYDRLNICLERLGRYDDALDRMLTLCKIKPNSHQIHFETGRMAILCKEYDLAKEHLEFAVGLEPFDMFARYHLALTLFYLGDEQSINKAKFECSQILQSKPNDEKCLNLMAKIHIQQNEWNEALEVYQRMSAKKETPYLKYQMGVVYENMEKEAESIHAFESAANVWLKYVKQIGYDKYFYNRPKEAKALQKIQSRCDLHQAEPQWRELNDMVFQIGLS